MHRLPRLPRFFPILLLVIALSACTVTEGPVSITVSTDLGTPTATAPAPLADNEVRVTLPVTLYSGPGRYYEETGSTVSGATLRVTSRDETGEWYQLDDGRWINAFALATRPDVPIASAITGRVVAEVIDVLDGDTLQVLYDGRLHEVRYLLSNNPQVEQPFGQEAYERNLELTEGQTVYLEKDTTEADIYGRLLRYVYLDDDTMVNEALLRSGHAQIALFPPDDRYEERLRQAEGEARAQELGIWAMDIIPYREVGDLCIYTVQPGESLFVIARRFGLTLDQLAAANDVEDPNLVQSGVDLVIPGCGRNPVPPTTATPDTSPAPTPTPEPAE